jgi:anti-sigma B factor antagonist
LITHGEQPRLQTVASPWECKVHVQHSPTGRVAVLILHGELDLLHAHDLRRALHHLAGARLVVVDLAAVTYLDSTILGVLVGCLRRAAESGGGLVVINASGIPERVLRITGLGSLLGLPGAERTAGRVKERV